MLQCNWPCTRAFGNICHVQLDWTSNTSRQKINFPTNQKGDDNSETIVGKLSARRIQIFRVYFLWSFFGLLFFKTGEDMTPTKYSRKIWIRLVEYSSSEVSDPSEVPRFVGKSFFYLVKDFKLICVRLIISRSCVQAIVQYACIDLYSNIKNRKFRAIFTLVRRVRLAKTSIWAQIANLKIDAR